MAGPHDEFADLAVEMIAENGRAMKVRKLSRTPADPAKPWRGPAATAPDGYEFDLDVVAVVIDWTEAEYDQDQTRRDSQRLLIAAKPFATATPTPFDLKSADSLLDEGRVYSLSKGNLLKPGTTAILYDFQLRQ
jgi:hypothetical protein